MATAIDCRLEPLVAAPATESSGTSAGLTAAQDHRQIATEPWTLPQLTEVTAFTPLRSVGEDHTVELPGLDWTAEGRTTGGGRGGGCAGW